MDRMSFIPGKEKREFFHDAEGHIFFGRQTAMEFADEFLPPFPEYTVLNMQMMHCLAEDDEVDIWFGLTDDDVAEGGEEPPQDRELPGRTWASITRKQKTEEKKTFLEVGRDTMPTPLKHATRAFNAYRRELAAHQGVTEPSPHPVVAVTGESEDVSRVSRALSPTNLYHNSGVMWYFVDIASIMPFGSDEMTLTRPMSAEDALILTVLLTICIGWAPGVYAVYQEMPLGGMPTSFQKATSADVVKLKEGEIGIIC